MIKFPEIAYREWEAEESKVTAKMAVRARIERDTLVERELERLRVRHEAQVLFQQELDEENMPALEMFTLDDYRNDPGMVPVDLIEGLVVDEGVTTVVGPSRSGKSTLALQMVYSLLMGKDWLGRKVTKLKGSAGIVSYDMDARQMLNWVSGFPKLKGSRIVAVNAYKNGNPLGVPHVRSQIVEEMKRKKVEVVIIDSFSASFFGHDQNDSAATMAHYRDLKRFALGEVGARLLIVVVHSTKNKPNEARGSSVHIDTPDNIVSVVPDENGKRRVTSEKYREAVGGQKQMEPLIITAPDNVTHLVELDAGAMHMAGLPLPEAVKAKFAFADTPKTHEAPEKASEEEEEE